MSNLKSFSVGHTAKGAIWWQAWPFDGDARKGTTDTIGGALVEIGIDAGEWRSDARIQAQTERANLLGIDRDRLVAELAECQAENLRLAVKVSALIGTIDRMESLLPDSTDPAPQAADKGPSSPVAPRKPVKASKGPSAVQDGPMADSDPVGAYLTVARHG